MKKTLFQYFILTLSLCALPLHASDERSGVEETPGFKGRGFVIKKESKALIISQTLKEKFCWEPEKQEPPQELSSVTLHTPSLKHYQRYFLAFTITRKHEYNYRNGFGDLTFDKIKCIAEAINPYHEILLDKKFLFAPGRDAPCDLFANGIADYFCGQGINLFERFKSGHRVWIIDALTQVEDGIKMKAIAQAAATLFSPDLEGDQRRSIFYTLRNQDIPELLPLCQQIRALVDNFPLNIREKPKWRRRIARTIGHEKAKLVRILLRAAAARTDASAISAFGEIFKQYQTTLFTPDVLGITLIESMLGIAGVSKIAVNTIEEIKKRAEIIDAYAAIFLTPDMSTSDKAEVLNALFGRDIAMIGAAARILLESANKELTGRDRSSLAFNLLTMEDLASMSEIYEIAKESYESTFRVLAPKENRRAKIIAELIGLNSKEKIEALNNRIKALDERLEPYLNKLFTEDMSIEDFVCILDALGTKKAKARLDALAKTLTNESISKQPLKVKLMIIKSLVKLKSKKPVDVPEALKHDAVANVLVTHATDFFPSPAIDSLMRKFIKDFGSLEDAVTMESVVQAALPLFTPNMNTNHRMAIAIAIILSKDNDQIIALGKALNTCKDKLFMPDMDGEKVEIIAAFEKIKCPIVTLPLTEAMCAFLSEDMSNKDRVEFIKTFTELFKAAEDLLNKKAPEIAVKNGFYGPMFHGFYKPAFEAIKTYQTALFPTNMPWKSKLEVLAHLIVRKDASTILPLAKAIHTHASVFIQPWMKEKAKTAIIIALASIDNPDKITFMVNGIKDHPQIKLINKAEVYKEGENDQEIEQEKTLFDAKFINTVAGIQNNAKTNLRIAFMLMKQGLFTYKNDYNYEAHQKRGFAFLMKFLPVITEKNELMEYVTDPYVVLSCLYSKVTHNYLCNSDIRICAEQIQEYITSTENYIGSELDLGTKRRYY